MSDKKYSADEIAEAVHDWSELSYANDGYATAALLRGEPVKVEKVGGKPAEEGEGEYIYVVVKVGDQFFRKDGYYASHYGSDWDGAVTEVYPVEKTVTFYEPR